MASSSSTKAACATCGNKSAGVFRCEGCLNIFCRKHSNEHRDQLNQQLDEIIHEHDILQHSILEKKNHQDDRHYLLTQIEKWEEDSIMKIRITAKEAREQVEKLLTSGNETISTKLHDLAEQIRKARADDDFVETDLHLMTTKLQELKINTADVLSSITLREDTNIPLVAKLNISKTAQKLDQVECLVSIRGNIQIEDNGRKAIQYDSSGYSFVCFKNEHSVGRYQIKFTMNRMSSQSDVGFGIVTNAELFYKWPVSSYGWLSDGSVSCGGQIRFQHNSAGHDLKGKSSFTIELVLDCDNRKIQYFTDQATNRQELDIDLEKCPFPWQIFFHLYEVGDYVQLV